MEAATGRRPGAAQGRRATPTAAEARGGPLNGARPGRPVAAAAGHPIARLRSSKPPGEKARAAEPLAEPLLFRQGRAIWRAAGVGRRAGGQRARADRGAARRRPRDKAGRAVRGAEGPRTRPARCLPLKFWAEQPPRTTRPARGAVPRLRGAQREAQGRGEAAKVPPLPGRSAARRNEASWPRLARGQPPTPPQQRRSREAAAPTGANRRSRAARAASVIPEGVTDRGLGRLGDPRRGHGSRRFELNSTVRRSTTNGSDRQQCRAHEPGGAAGPARLYLIKGRYYVITSCLRWWK